MVKLKKRLIKVPLNKNKNFSVRFFLIAVLILLILFLGIYFSKNKLSLSPQLLVVPAWDAIANTDIYDKGNALTADSDGNVYITGFNNGSGDVYQSNSNVWTLKYDSNGYLLWNKTFDGASGDPSGLHPYRPDEGKAIAVDSQGNIYVTGYTSPFVNYLRGLLLLKYDSAGNLIWEKIINHYDSSEGKAIAVDSQGNIYVTGVTTIEYGGFGKAWTLKFNPSGSLLWNRTLIEVEGYGKYTNYGSSIEVSSTGEVYISGAITTGDYDYSSFIAKYSPSGILLWKKLAIPKQQTHPQQIIKLDSGGNIFYITSTYNLSEGKILISKYDSSGNLLTNKTIVIPSGYEINVNAFKITNENFYLIVNYVSSLNPISKYSTKFINLSSNLDVLNIINFTREDLATSNSLITNNQEIYSMTNNLTIGALGNLDYNILTTKYGFSYVDVSVCGDRICSAGETCSTCSGDCGACSAPLSITLPADHTITNNSLQGIACQKEQTLGVNNLQIFVWNSSGENLFQPVMISHSKMQIDSSPIFDSDGSFYTFKYQSCSRDSYCPQSSAEQVIIKKYSSNLAFVWSKTLDRFSAGSFAEPNTIYYYHEYDSQFRPEITPNGVFIQVTAKNTLSGNEKFVMFKLGLNTGAVSSVTNFNTEYKGVINYAESTTFQRGNNLYQLKTDNSTGDYYLQKFDFNLNKVEETFLYSPPQIPLTFTRAPRSITLSPIGNDSISLQQFAINGTDLVLVSHIIFDNSNNILFEAHNKSIGPYSYELIATPDLNKDLYYFRTQQYYSNFYNISLYKFNPSFDVVWNKDLLDKNEKFNNTFFSFQPYVSFVLDNSNSVLFSGMYNLNFNDSVLGKNLVKDYFIGKYSKNGNLLWKFVDENNPFPTLREQGKIYDASQPIKIIRGNFLKIYHPLVKYYYIPGGVIYNYYIDYFSFNLPEKELISNSQMSANFYFPNFGNYKIGCLGTDKFGNMFWAQNVSVSYVSGPTTPSQICGNSLIEGNEVCDDGNLNNDDGCSISCQVENGWACSGAPSVCARIINCVDSDGGLNYFVKGNVNFGSLNYEDKCKSVTNLPCDSSGCGGVVVQNCSGANCVVEEFFCDPVTGGVGYNPYYCSQSGKICQNGACVSPPVSCSINLTNNTLDWQNVSCLTNDKMNQSRTIVQYDSNNCGNYTNQTTFEYRQTEGCNFCTEIILGPFTTECNVSNKYTKYWTSNYESCCAITRLESDCQILRSADPNTGIDNYLNKTLDCIFVQSDIDLDGISDAEDNLLWNQSYVQTNLDDLVIKANGIVAHGSFDGPRDFAFYRYSTSSDVLLMFNYNISKKIDFSKFFLNLTEWLFIFNSLGQVNEDKHLFFPKKDPNIDSICLKNSEIFSESEFSSNCGATDEIDFRSCIGGSAQINGVTCLDGLNYIYFGGDLVQANVLLNGIEFCGDYVCNNGESCSTCSNDCGNCVQEFCGDETCNNGEECATCSQDCGQCPASCGDETCNGNETCLTCSGDCGACVCTDSDGGLNYFEKGNVNFGSLNYEDKCKSVTNLPCDSSGCGGLVVQNCSGVNCVVEEFFCDPVTGGVGYNPYYCSSQTCLDGACVSVCGDGNCTLGETCSTCANDCGNCATQYCGDNSCNNGEDCSSCSADCGSCGGGGGGGGGGGTIYKACNDKKDNDKDGLKDFPADPGCASKYDTDERDVIITPVRNYTSTPLDKETIEIIQDLSDGEISDKKLSKKAIVILISVIALIVLAIVIILIIFYKKRKQNSSSQQLNVSQKKPPVEKSSGSEKLFLPPSNPFKEVSSKIKRT